ncbi:MAG: FAD-dependent oxidoreductase [Chloroflexi bacterium]|nr:FAD-dependent oxidoreductase [Chloroflexota bacterium]
MGAEGEQAGLPAAQMDVADALDRLRAVVGAEHVLQQPAQVEPYSWDTLPEVTPPLAIVAPASAEEVQAVVRIARAAGLPLWPVSRGKNWAYGAATPSLAGTVVLTLERLDRIVEVNDELCYAVVEPGVTFGQLQEHLERRGGRLWVDPTDSTPHGSVIGNALDHGIGSTPYADHFANLCGLDVVLPDGQLVSSGGRGDSTVFHTYRWGLGPTLDGLFGQSGFGVVVRAGVWLMPAPESHVFYVLELDREDAIAPAVDGLRRLLLEDRVRTQVHVLNDMARLALAIRCPHPLGADRTSLSQGERHTLCRQHGIARWSASGGLYGSTAQVREQQRELAATIRPYGRVRFIDARRLRAVERLLGGIQALAARPLLGRPARGLARRLFGKSLDVMEAMPHAYERSRGRPTSHFLRFAYYKSSGPLPPDELLDPARDGGGLIWFAPSLPSTGQHLTAVLDLCRPLFEEHGFDFSAAIMGQNARTISLVMGILYYKDDPAEAARAAALYRRLCDVTADAGYPRYRVSAPRQPHALDDVPAYRAVVEQLRGALDPGGILAPGRYGVGRPAAGR